LTNRCALISIHEHMGVCYSLAPWSPPDRPSPLSTLPRLDLGGVLIEFELGPELAQLASERPMVTRTAMAFM
jgi:hypothetical protein